MAGLLQRTAARVFGLPTTDQVSKLEGEVASLEQRVRQMRATASGVAVEFGEFEYEYIEGLKGDDRWLIYDKMESDPLIKEGLDAIVHPLSTGKWEIQPAGDKSVDKEIAEFVAANLLRQASDRYGRDYFLQTSFTGQRLIEILDFLKCGFSMFAKSTRVIDGKIVYDRLQWLEPRSVDPRGWDLSETDEINFVARTYSTPAPTFKFREPLPAAQIVLYPWDFRGARYEGRPKIRSLYGAFTRKDAMLRYSVIWAQKVGAPMPIGQYPSNWTPAERSKFEEIVRSMRGQAPAEAYGLVPFLDKDSKAELGYAGLDAASAGQVDRMRGLINGENAEIAHGSGTKSRLLGETTNGSRSTGEVQSQDEDITIDTVVARICEIESDGVANLPGVIQELVDWNFPNVKQYPRLICSRVGPREDFRTLAPMIQAITAGITPLVPEVRKQVTEKFGIALKDEDYNVEPPAAGDGTQPAKPGQPPQKKPAPAQQNERVAADAIVARQLDLRLGLERLMRLDDVSVAQKPQGLGRPPTQFESKVCLLGPIAATMNTGSDQLTAALRRATAAMTEDILRRAEAGKLQRSEPTGLRRTRPKNEAALVASVRDRFLDVAREGRSQARAEVARQEDMAGKGKALGLQLDAGAEDSNMLPAGAAVPVSGEVAAEIAALIEQAGGPEGVISILTTELAGEARIASQIAIDEIWARLLDEAIREYNAAIRSGLSEADAIKSVESVLHGLSTARTDLAGRQISEVAYVQGRDMAAKEAAVAGEAKWVVRSEVLDSRTCKACQNLDGIYLKIGTKEYEKYLPPAMCEGGDNCRGFPIIVSDALARELDKEYPA